MPAPKNSVGPASALTGSEAQGTGNTTSPPTPAGPNRKAQRTHAPIRIDVKPTTSGRKWRAALDGKALCVSTSPLIASARILIAKGFDPARIIEMWHADSSTWALRGQLGAIAAVVLDGEGKAQRRAKNGLPMHSCAENGVQPIKGKIDEKSGGAASSPLGVAFDLLAMEDGQ
jgi:hypothetical protein